MKRFSLTEGIIITENDEFQENYPIDDQKYKIAYIPIWKWLLNDA